MGPPISSGSATTYFTSLKRVSGGVSSGRGVGMSATALTARHKRRCHSTLSLHSLGRKPTLVNRRCSQRPPRNKADGYHWPRARGRGQNTWFEREKKKKKLRGTVLGLLTGKGDYVVSRHHEIPEREADGGVPVVVMTKRLSFMTSCRMCTWMSMEKVATECSQVVQRMESKWEALKPCPLGQVLHDTGVGQYTYLDFPCVGNACC